MRENRSLELQAYERMMGNLEASDPGQPRVKPGRAPDEIQSEIY
jgi:hypothetical protein